MFQDLWSNICVSLSFSFCLMHFVGVLNMPYEKYGVKICIYLYVYFALNCKLNVFYRIKMTGHKPFLMAEYLILWCFKMNFISKIPYSLGASNTPFKYFFSSLRWIISFDVFSVRVYWCCEGYMEVFESKWVKPHIKYHWG